MFKLTIKTDNAAFGDDPAIEIARLLRVAADKIQQGYGGDLFDYNGNKVGSFTMNAAEED